MSLGTIRSLQPLRIEPGALSGECSKWGFEDLGDPRVVLLIVLCRSEVVNPGMVCQHITAQRSVAQFMPAATTLPSLSPPMPTPFCARPEKGHARLPPLQPISPAAHYPIWHFPAVQQPCKPVPGCSTAPAVPRRSDRTPNLQIVGMPSGAPDLCMMRSVG